MTDDPFIQDELDKFTPFLERVDLQPFSTTGIIPIFAHRMPQVVSTWYEHWCRQIQANGKPRPSFEAVAATVYKNLDIQAKVGAIAAGITDAGSDVYDIGCGVAIPSLVYTMLTGRRVFAFDSDENEVLAAKRLAQAMGIDSKIEFSVKNVQDFLSEKRHSSKDTLILSNAPKEITDYVLDTLNDGGPALIHSAMYTRDYIQSDEFALYLRNRFIINGFNLKIGFAKGYDTHLVTIATRRQD